MKPQPISLLIVDDDLGLVSALPQEAAARGYLPVGATSVAEADAALDSAPVSAAALAPPYELQALWAVVRAVTGVLA